MKPYAIWAFNEYPELQEVKTKFIYVEHGTERQETFTRDQYSQLVKDLFDDTKACENGERYKKVVGPLCDYCDFKKYGFCTGEIDKEEIQDFGGLDF